MKHKQEIVKALVLGEGQAALSLAFGVIALGIFPIPVVVYICYIVWLGYAEAQAHRWLRRFLTSWPRLWACGALSLGCIAGAWRLRPPEPDLLIADLHPVTFSFYTLMLIGVGLFWTCVDTAKELRRGQMK